MVINHYRNSLVYYVFMSQTHNINLGYVKIKIIIHIECNNNLLNDKNKQFINAKIWL